MQHVLGQHVAQFDSFDCNDFTLDINQPARLAGGYYARAGAHEFSYNDALQLAAEAAAFQCARVSV